MELEGPDEVSMHGGEGSSGQHKMPEPQKEEAGILKRAPEPRCLSPSWMTRMFR